MIKENQKTKKELNDSQKLANKIVDKLKSGAIEMNDGREVTGEGLSGTEFESTNLPKGVSVIVAIAKSEAKKNPSYKLTFKDGSGINRSFAGGPARRAYRIVTKVDVDKNIPAEEITAISSVLDALG